MDPWQEMQKQHTRDNPTQERHAHQRHQHHSSTPSISRSDASGPLGAHLQDQQPRARIISLPAYKRHSSTITAGALNRTLDRSPYTAAAQIVQSHDQYSQDDRSRLVQSKDTKGESDHDKKTRPARYASSGSDTPDSSNSREHMRKGSGRTPADTVSHYPRPTQISQSRRIPSPARTHSHSTTEYNDSFQMSDSKESGHETPTVPRTAVRSRKFDHVKHPQGHVALRRRQSPYKHQSFSPTYDRSDEDSHGKVRMARRESITSSFATTRTLPPPNIARIAHMNVSTPHQTDFKQRIQDLKSSLASRQLHVDDAQRIAGRAEHEHCNNVSEDRSITVMKSIVSSGVDPDSTPERSHEVENDEGDDNEKNLDASASKKNNDDDARNDLRNIRDEIHDMLAALERSKVESRQMQQWIVERSDLERKLREEWFASNSEAQRLLLRQQRQIELASQRPSSRVLHEQRANRRHISTFKEQTSSQEVKESSIDDVDLTSDSTIPPTLCNKRNRTHLWVHRPTSMEFGQNSFSSDASSEYRNPDRPENPVISLGMKTDDGTEGIQCITNRRDLARKYILWRVARVCFWMLFTFALHIVLMGFLFRPITLAEDGSTMGVADKNRREHRSSIRYKGRDYVSGQPGFYTFLSDGFGTDSLAYCYDIVHYPGREDRSWGSSLLGYVLDGIAHAHSRWVSLSKVSWNSRPMQQLHNYWSSIADRIKRMIDTKRKDETLDWVFAEQQVQAQ